MIAYLLVYFIHILLCAGVLVKVRSLRFSLSAVYAPESAHPFAIRLADGISSCYAYRRHTWALLLSGEGKYGETTDGTSTTCSPEHTVPSTFGGWRPSQPGDVPRPL